MILIHESNAKTFVINCFSHLQFPQVSSYKYNVSIQFRAGIYRKKDSGLIYSDAFCLNIFAQSITEQD
jgi:hypothetical protein